ncbi:LUD domain-containing protein [Halovivax gelatinilyticus]|uniref:LUD domain-containing protein n=1 Tax=Halovivax gelatinilyticus TaxID=2961597 RepID=UPI0020CA434E|nr:LUD domain-containing protein [Halovivax gelatinilyticus]
MPDEYFTKDDFDDALDIEAETFDQVPDDETVERVISNVEDRNIAVSVFDEPDAAVEHLEAQLSGAETVNNGHSTTLKEIGFVDVLEAEDGFEYVGNRIAEIDDDDERFEARRNAMTVDLLFDSVNAIAESGELIGANALGNGVGAWPFGAKRLILVGSTNKIEPSWAAAVERVREYALPLEDARAEEVYGQGSTVGKLVSIERETVDDRTELVLLDDRYGF